MIRISWCDRKNPEEHFHGSWYPDGDGYILRDWIEALSKMYPMINHWIEKDSGDS